MSKNYFIELAAYNNWANGITHSWLEQLTDEQWSQPVVSSFNSIAETVIHVAGAETVWLDRLRMVPAENQVWLPAVFKGSKKEAVDLWKQSSQNLETFVRDFEETKLQADLPFKRLNGDAYIMPHYQLFAHVFNHSTYHRGQLVTMLRQVGFTGVNPTDIMIFFRK